MDTFDTGEQGAIARAQFVCLLLIHKSDIGMADVDDDELETLAPAILGSLVRLSLRALRDPDEPDNADRLAALRWFVEWAWQSIEGFLEAALSARGDASQTSDLPPVSMALRN